METGTDSQDSHLITDDQELIWCSAVILNTRQYNDTDLHAPRSAVSTINANCQLFLTMSEDNIPDVFREPSEFLRSLVTDLLQYCPQLHEQDPQSCHGRLVQDICLETPHLKTSKFSQAKKALIEEVKVNKISENFQNFIFRNPPLVNFN